MHCLLLFVGPSLSHFDELFLNTPLGCYMANKVNEKIRKDFFERYLRDFVSMTFTPSDEELEVSVNISRGMSKSLGLE